ncbi:MAG: hypothetical protein QM757_12275 [Paludibaculum sp.]
MKPTRGNQSAQVQIRVRNASNLDFDQIRVTFPDGREVDYGPLSKGASSNFREATQAYRYAGVSVTAAGRTISLTPADYLGEKELPAGRYTYVLKVSGGQLTVELEPAE